MKKLWEKNWKLDSFIEAFETKDDLLLDQKLLKFDVLASIAHAQMLLKIKIISKNEFVKLKTGLLEILELDNKNQFQLKQGDEDIHTKIENYLTEKYGEVGKKIHSGRSRNDQVLTAIRLFIKENIFSVWQDLLILTEGFLAFAKKYEFTPMPGYTHMQKAMPSSLGMWAGSFVESLLDDSTSLKTAYKINNQSPLGSAAGYGIPLSLDRECVKNLLCFDKVQNNSLYCQNSRGKFEAEILSSLITILLTINKFASDVLLFTTSEFEYFTVSQNLCSGSSLMPQKKNIDIAELLRSKVHLVLGNYIQIVSTSGNLISGYNRDLQDTKKPLIESLEITQNSIKATSILIKNLSPKKDVLDKALTPEIFATYKAIELVKKGVAFRKAYQSIGSKISEIEQQNIDQVLQYSLHAGGTGNLKLDSLGKSLKTENKFFESEKNNYLSAIKKLMEGGENNENSD